MTSKEGAKCDAAENRRRSPLDLLPPPANSNKPLTPFSIDDILNKPSVKRSYAICGRDGMTLFGQRSTPKKRRKSRTAFTNHQIYELEKRFLYQKYLSPADRDQIAQQLGLTNAQVITWFQNRRAKLKRDLEEMKADVESAKAIGQVPLDKLAKLADLEKCANGTLGHPRAESPARGGSQDHQHELAQKLRSSPLSPFSDHTTSKECSEDEDVEIDVDD
ncbi:hypothetical protein CRENBAI_017718 [Crenichthys baileyi]|uniref:Homeobox domain-containing protein n=1 Tax=Crenichthys baileyi TaxID=28760 RepID=A0AAV9R3R5_9TELE